jgi:predicted transcriptional regulator
MRVIEVTLSELEEKIEESLKTRSLTANQISYLLEGYGWPLSSWQLSHILSQMTRMGILSRERSGKVFRYKRVFPLELNPES